MRSLRLGEVVDILSGFAFPSEQFGDSGNLPVVRIRDVVPGRSSTFFQGEFDDRFIVSDGDILIGMDGEFNRARWRGGRALLNQRVCRIRPSSDWLDDGYLFYYLPAVLKAIEDVTPFVTVKHLSAKQIRDIAISLPPVPEQRHVAAILAKADELLAKRRAALAQLNGLIQSMFLEMFGDPATNPRGLPRVPLRMLGTVVTGGTPSRDIPGYYGNEIEWIKSDNINTAGAFLTKAVERLSVGGRAVARTAPSGSILVTCIAGTPACIGNVAIADREVAFNQQINALIPESNVDPYFLYGQFVAGKKLVQQASTGGMKGMVSKSRFEGIQFIVPPQHEQVAFGRQFISVQALIGEQHTSLNRLTELFASLQHHAFAGAL